MEKEKRKNLKPQERRAQFIQIAQNLFFTKGFDETTMADIIDAAGVSKGGFYHHFKSKEDLLFGVVDTISETVISEMESILDNPKLTGLELLQRFLHLRSDYLKAHDYAGQLEFFRSMNDDKNMILLQGFKQQMIKIATPTLIRIIEKGCTEGVFKTDSPPIAASMIFYINSFIDQFLKIAIDARKTDGADAAAASLQSAIDMQFLTIDRILNLPDGTTNFGWPEMVQATMAAAPIHTFDNKNIDT